MLRLIHNCCVLTVLVLVGCAYENEEELFGNNPCDSQQTTYSGIINPILMSSCAIPTCHDGSNPARPDWSILENVQANALSIKQRTGNRTMPPSNSGLVLTQEEVNDIACWVDSGAQDN